MRRVICRVSLLALLGACDKEPLRPGLPANGDTTLLRVVLTSPPHGKSGVAVNRPPISVVFSRPLDPASITNASFYLDKGPAATVQYSAGATSATLIPRSVFAHGATYTAVVTTAVQDTAGNRLARSYSWSFMTKVVGSR